MLRVVATLGTEEDSFLALALDEPPSDILYRHKVLGCRNIQFEHLVQMDFHKQEWWGEPFYIGLVYLVNTEDPHLILYNLEDQKSRSLTIWDLPNFLEN